MVYKKIDELILRSIEPNDARGFEIAFLEQDWHKSREQFEQYYSEQESGKRQVIVAEKDGRLAGYVTLLPEVEAGSFGGKHLPEICDFNVLKKFQRQGIGSALMDMAEELAAQLSDVVTLGVGMHSGYGSAQRMYVKRGYLPDGTGVWYQDKQLLEGAACNNDDDLVLYFSKLLK